MAGGAFNTEGSINIDTVAFSKVVKKLGKRYGVVAKAVLYDQHRLYTEDLLKGTPPFKLKDGKTSITKDLKKLFITIDNSLVLDWYSENFGKKPKSTSKKVKNATQDLESKGVLFNWTGDRGAIKRFHKRYRTGPNKGVRFKSRERKVGGDLVFGSGMYLTKAKFNAYRREVWKSIGKLKAGWIPAARHFGARIPSFVAKQPFQQGGFVDKWNKLLSAGTLTSINKIPYASKRLRQLERFASKKRQKAMDSHLKGQVAIAMKNWSTAKNG
jgi:hypothetical protein